MKNRWSKPTLIVDAGFLLFMGISSYIWDRMSYSDGTGMFGKALQGSPHVLGFIEAHLLIIVIGLGLLIAGFTGPSVPWHVFAVLGHIALASVDFTYRDYFEEMGLSSATAPAIVTVHAILITAHIVSIVRVRSVARVSVG